MHYYDGFGFSGFGGGMFFGPFPLFFIIIFVIVMSVFIYTAVSGAKQWNKNNQSPVLTVSARIVAKRGDTRRRTHHHDNMHHRTTTTMYYVTFEVQSGDRIELVVPGSEYGLLVEEDEGLLTFQGTRYKGFERQR